MISFSENTVLSYTSAPHLLLVQTHITQNVLEVHLT